MSVIDLSTEDDLKYTFYPISNGCVNFKVKSPNDAHVSLTTGPEESDPMVEIFLGGWGNTKSVIRRNRTKPDKAEVSTEGILNGDEFRGFWVRWSNGSISAGKEGESEPFISWDDPEPFQIGHVGVCTGWGATGIWKIEGRFDVETNDQLEYKFNPVLSGELQFEFQGPSNCHIALTNGPAENDPMYEVILGGWENKKSVIRHCRQKPDKVVTDTESIVHPGEFRKFLIQWTSGRVVVRACVGSGPLIMEWTDDSPFPVTHFGVRTAWGATGKWKIMTSSVPCERVPPASVASAPAALIMDSSSYWVGATSGEVPPGAVVAGQDQGEDMFIARASHEGALIPGKLLSSHGCCYVPWGGAENGKNEYEVLCGAASNWVRTSGAAIPENALPGGESEDSETLFIGRVEYEGSVTVGKVQASHGVCYIAYGGQELDFADYEVLCSH